MPSFVRNFLTAGRILGWLPSLWLPRPVISLTRAGTAAQAPSAHLQTCDHGLTFLGSQLWQAHRRVLDSAM